MVEYATDTERGWSCLFGDGTLINPPRTWDAAAAGPFWIRAYGKRDWFNVRPRPVKPASGGASMLARFRRQNGGGWPPSDPPAVGIFTLWALADRGDLTVDAACDRAARLAMVGDDALADAGFVSIRVAQAG